MNAIRRNFELNIIRKYRNNSTLTIEDMPRLRSMPLVGKAINYINVSGGKRLHEYIDIRHKQLGPVFAERLDRKTELVFISDPSLMKALFMTCEGKYPMHVLPESWVLYEKLYGAKRGLFFMDGEEWLRNRKIMNKYLLRGDEDNWLQTAIGRAVTNFITVWKSKAKPKYAIVDLETDLYNLSINVIINVLAGRYFIERSPRYDDLVSMFGASVKQIFQNTTKLYGLPLNWCQRLNLKVWRNFKESVDVSLLLSNKIVNELLSQKHKCNGLINRLVEENVSEDDITRIVSDLIIASGDTTAYTTLWILSLLSKNQNIIDEIRQKDRSYINNVLKETMRLYPVAPFLTRILPKDTQFGDYKLKQGTPIIASIYTSGRDEQNFSKPEQFLPYRWDRTDSRKSELFNHIPPASLPFALGSRSCIGKKIAMLQLNEVTAQIVNNFDLECRNKVNAITSQILVPDAPLSLTVAARSDASP